MRVVERSKKKLVLIFDRDERGRCIDLVRPSVGGVDVFFKGDPWNPDRGVHLDIGKAKITIEEAEG